MLKLRSRKPYSMDAAAMDQLRLQVSAGLPPESQENLPERARRALKVAVAAGASLADALDGAQAAQDDVLKSKRAVAVASAQTKAVAIGLLVAPVVLVPGLGAIVGADLTGFYSSGIGLAVLAVAGALMAVGATMVVALIRRIGRAGNSSGGGGTPAIAAVAAGAFAWLLFTPVVAPLAALFVHHLASRGKCEPEPPDVDEAADLAATALAGGVSVPEALRIAADELDELAPKLRRLAFGLELGMPPEVLSGSGGANAAATSAGGGLDRLTNVLITAETVGAPVAPTLRRLAQELRADELARVLAAAERLPAQLTFPTALCLLPATVLLVGAPIVHTGLGATGL